MPAILTSPIGANEVIIDDGNYQDYLSPVVDGERKMTGLMPPLPQKYEMRSGLTATFDIPLIPENEWADRLEEQIKQKAQLSDVRNRGKFGGVMPSTDQGSYGYCWCHSSTSAALLARAINNQPYVALSAYAVGCIIKNYRNQGGWGEESLKFIADRGIPSEEFWPQKSTKRENDNPNTWANAALHKFTSEWMSLNDGSMKAQLVTCLLLGIPVVSDFNWWSHSVCTMDLVSISPFRTRIWNSWGDGWSQNGSGILEGSKAVPSDALAPRVIWPSVV